MDHLPTPGTRKIVRLHGAKIDNNAHLVKGRARPRSFTAFAKGAIEVVPCPTGSTTGSRTRQTDRERGHRQGSQFGHDLGAERRNRRGAVQALREDGRDGKVLITGQDAELSACRCIAAGSQTMTIYKPLKLLAGRAAEIAVAMAKGRPVVARGEIAVESASSSDFVEVLAVTKDNLRETVVADGFHPQQAISPARER